MAGIEGFRNVSALGVNARARCGGCAAGPTLCLRIAGISTWSFPRGSAGLRPQKLPPHQAEFAKISRRHWN